MLYLNSQAVDLELWFFATIGLLAVREKIQNLPIMVKNISLTKTQEADQKFLY